jgi:hypothetical protein
MRASHPTRPSLGPAGDPGSGCSVPPYFGSILLAPDPSTFLRDGAFHQQHSEHQRDHNNGQHPEHIEMRGRLRTDRTWVVALLGQSSLRRHHRGDRRHRHAAHRRPRQVAPAARARREPDRPGPAPVSVRRRRSLAPLAAGRTPNAAHRPWRRAAAPDRNRAVRALVRLCSWRQWRSAHAAARPGYRRSPRRVAGPSVGSLPPLRSRVPWCSRRSVRRVCNSRESDRRGGCLQWVG